MIKTGKRYCDSIRDDRELYIDGEALTARIKPRFRRRQP